MKKNKIELPGVITKDIWFYEDNKDQLEVHLGKPYISYSTVSSWAEYREDSIKQKITKLKSYSSTVYTELGNYLGEAVETGEFSKENPNGFTGQENLKLIPRPGNAEYEKFIVLDMGDYIIIGFIDIFWETEEGVNICDLKTGGKKKEDTYKSADYIQVILYARALERLGMKINSTSVWFVRRTGSHINPPLHISDEQFRIPLEYSKERVTFALDKVDKVVNEISNCLKVYNKIFK